jgi:hypothetical protein
MKCVVAGATFARRGSPAEQNHRGHSMEKADLGDRIIEYETRGAGEPVS